MDIILKLKKANLKGRSGSNFPTYLKWETVKKQKANSKYVICNASEGEPLVKKDYFILKKYKEEVIEGIMLALKTVHAKTAIIYINKAYYNEFKEDLIKLTKNLPIELFEKPKGYLCGEETCLLNVIEGKEKIPRPKPPFPTEKGLYGKPTLINNVETFYYVNQINKKEYLNTKFYSIIGPKTGVFELSIDLTIKEILEQTGNMPKYDFFLQVGGGAVGEIMLKKEIGKPLRGLGSIIVFDKEKTNVLDLMKQWASFFAKENCDRCTPCREGAYRIKEMLEQKIDKKILRDIFFILENASLCPFGKSLPVPFKTAIKKLL